MKKKLIGLIVMLAVTALAAPAFAAEKGSTSSQVWDGSVDVSWYTEQPLDTADYYISTPSQLAGLAYMVNGRLDADQFPEKSSVSSTVAAVTDGAEDDGKTVSGLTAESFWTKKPTHIKTEGGGSGVTDYTLYIGNQKYDFAGKTIHLTSDIDLGGTYKNDKASGPNWMPIGGRFPADPGKLTIIVDSAFNGCLDGGGHTINNLFCDRQSGGNYMWSQGVGFIGCLGDLYDDPLYKYGHSAQPESAVKEEILKGWTATVRNLCVGNSSDSASFHGYIYANRMVGGIVGRAGSAVIENCANFTTLKTTDHKGTGGIIGATDGEGTIRGCYNAGYIYSTSNGCPTGGIAGSNTFNIYNCYNCGKIYVPNEETLSEGIGSHFGGSYVVDNCYSLNGTWTDSREETTINGYYFGNGIDLVVNTYAVDQGTMKSAAFLDEINAGAGDVFVAGRSGINYGYPILFWQADGMPQGSCSVSAGGGGGQGKILVQIPAGGYTAATVLQPGTGTDVPVGTVVTMVSDAAAPNVLEYFTAGQTALRADHYTVTGSGSVTLDGSFLTLARGTVTFADTPQYVLGVSKNGTVLDQNGKAWTVQDQMVSSGDTIFQNDVLTAKAVLRSGAVCKDQGREYSGSFDYIFSEGGAQETSASGVLKAGRSVTGGLQISASPRTQDKSWLTYADTSWCKDPDNIHGTYTISSPQQLAGLAKMVNGGETFSGAVVKLAGDISLKNPDDDGSVRTWTSIGVSSGKCFSGTFDGQGHMIRGMTVKSTGSVGGLFGYCKKAKIKDLTVTGSVESAGNAGGIASSLIGGNISGCVNRAQITARADRAGGIAAQLSEEGKITSCSNRGSVTGTSKVGGIVGESLHTAGSILKCRNTAEITATASGSGASCAGGIAGYLGSRVQQCANRGNVTSANACTGGIAGFTYANTKATETQYRHSSAIYDSYNTGNVTSTASGAGAFTGGIVGRADYLLMKNCFTTGRVEASSQTFLGAVAGGFYESIYNKVETSYYSADMSPATSYTRSGGTVKADTQNPSLSYFRTQKKSEADMKAPAFASLLESNSPGTFRAMAGDLPELAWIAGGKDCLVTYSGAYTGTDTVRAGSAVDLPVCGETGWKYVFETDGREFDGTGITADTDVTVSREKIRVAYVSFVKDNSQIDVNSDGKTDRKDCIAFYTEDGSGTAYQYISDRNIVTSEGGLTAIPDVSKVAAKAGHTAYWDLTDNDGVSYWDSRRSGPLGTGNISVRAVYDQRTLKLSKSDDGAGAIRYAAEISSSNDGYYFLAPQTKGTITVRSGAAVTLDGSNGPFVNVRFIVEKGAKLTLKNMVVRTDPARLAGSGRNAAVLEIAGGASRSAATTLKFSGYNSISGTNTGGNGTDKKGNRIICPAVDLKGYVKFTKAASDSDVLYITAAMDSPEVNLENRATMEVAGGIVEVYKKERLGTNGGMIYGASFDYKTKKIKGSQKGNLMVSGGSLIAVSESNNVFAACVNQYKQTGGQAIFYANEASQYRKGHQRYIGTDVAIYAKKMVVTGGSLSAKTRTHQDKLSDKIRYYSDSKCIGSGNNFTGKYQLKKISTAGWKGRTRTVKAGGKVIYKGAGNNVSYNIGKLNSFSTKKSAADKYIYLWVPKGSSGALKVQ